MAKNKLSGITEAHVRITIKILQSPVFIALPPNAVKLYIDMISFLRGTNNGNISATMTVLKHRGWNSPATLAKSLRQLEAVGLIAKTRETIGVHRGSKLCNLYRFTDRETYAQPKLHIQAHKETHDYLKFKTLTEAKKAIKGASETTPKKKTTQQKLQLNDTNSVALTQINDTDSEVTTPPSTTENVAPIFMRDASNPALHKAYKAICPPAKAYQ